jgi:hypothetical protein
MAPFLVTALFEGMVHPGVYRTVGLPGFATWKAANRTPERLEIRYTATRPILDTLLAAGVMRRGRVSRAWQKLCGVDRRGQPRSTITGA